MSKTAAPPSSQSARPASVPLWQQLQATARVLVAVRSGQSTTRLLPQLSAALRPGVQAQVFLVLRHLGMAQAIRAQLARKAPPGPADALLCTALALACAPEQPYENHVLVDQAVEAAKRQDPTRPQANFINACLRRYLREAAALQEAAAQDPVGRWNHPLWWIQQMKKEHPQTWQQVLLANNQHPPMSLRINTRQVSVDHYLQALTDAGMQAQRMPTAAGQEAVLLQHAVPVQQLPGFQNGWVSVQDVAAQMAAPLLLDGVQPTRVLDACAAPGGKTAHLLELCNAEVLALDVDPERCQRIHENLERLGLKAQIRAADAAEPAAWWDGHPFDAILLDAPCSASGIVRRHPDIRWLRRNTDIDQLALIQRKLLNQLWPLLRPGGRLLYCTCSVFLAEGQEQIETFLTRHTDAHLRTSPGHLLPLGPQTGTALPDNWGSPHDGFFYALLEKEAS